MLFVRFELGADAYVIEARQVREIVPSLSLKQLPGAPQGTVGLMNYRGRSLPVIDLSLMTLGQPAVQRLSTRILVVRLTALEDKLLGLLVERGTRMFTANPEQFQSSGLTLEKSPFLGPVCCDEGRLVQWVKPEHLLSPDLQQALYS